MSQVPDPLTIEECLAWCDRYERVPFNQLALEIAVKKDHPPMLVMASMREHLEQIYNPGVR